MDLAAKKLEQYFLNTDFTSGFTSASNIFIATGEVDGNKCLNLRSLSLITL